MPDLNLNLKVISASQSQTVQLLKGGGSIPVQAVHLTLTLQDPSGRTIRATVSPEDFETYRAMLASLPDRDPDPNSVYSLCNKADWVGAKFWERATRLVSESTPHNTVGLNCDIADFQGQLRCVLGLSCEPQDFPIVRPALEWALELLSKWSFEENEHSEAALQACQLALQACSPQAEVQASQEPNHS